MEREENVVARVAAGIEFLNENGPAEWWTRLDFETLDIADGDHCVLGQVFAAEADETGLVNGYIWATGSLPGALLDELDVIRLGFCTTLEENNITDNKIEREWERQVENLVTEVNA